VPPLRRLIRRGHRPKRACDCVRQMSNATIRRCSRVAKPLRFRNAQAAGILRCSQRRPASLKVTPKVPPSAWTWGSQLGERIETRSNGIHVPGSTIGTAQVNASQPTASVEESPHWKRICNPRRTSSYRTISKMLILQYVGG
jgi:hypothetical protein